MTLSSVVGDILPQAVGVALSPVPIIAVILVLFSARARSNGIAFVVGWVGALTLVSSLVLLATQAGLISDGGTPTDASYAFEAVLGLGLLALAVKQWRSRPAPGEEAAMPKWMSTIDSFSAGKSFGVAALLEGLNPKNIGLTLSAALTIAQADLPSPQLWVALGVFVLVGSITVLVPVVYYIAAGDSATKTLNTWKTWLALNNTTVMAVVLLLFGTKLLGDGIGGLLG